VKKSEEEKKITIIRAEAESDSANIFNDAIEKYGSAFLELKKLEAAREIVENLSKSKNVVFLPGNSNSEAGSGSSNFLFKI